MINVASFPRTASAPEWEAQLVEMFRRHEDAFSTERIDPALTCDEILAVLTGDLEASGFRIERHPGQNAKRLALFVDEDQAEVRYQIDVYQAEWRCCLAIEAASRAREKGYRDVVEPLLVVKMDTLCLAVPNITRPRPGEKLAPSSDYDHAFDLAKAVYGHTRVGLPRRLLLIGY